MHHKNFWTILQAKQDDDLFMQQGGDVEEREVKPSSLLNMVVGILMTIFYVAKL